jgi:hypothetical protein
MTEAEWLGAANATALWDIVRDRTGFHRDTLDYQGDPDGYHQRLLYLLGVALCRRLERLFPDPCCARVMQVAEAFAEGSATADELGDAHDDLDEGFRCSQAADQLPAANCAALEAVFWLSPDDYKVIRAVDNVSDAAGYLRAVAERALPASATHREGKAVWKHAAFLAGKADEEQVLCDLIRDVIGNPFHPVKVVSNWLAWNDGTVRRIAQGIYDERAFDRLPILHDALLDAGCDDEAILSHCRSEGPHVRGCWVIDLILGKE